MQCCSACKGTKAQSHIFAKRSAPRLMAFGQRALLVVSTGRFVAGADGFPTPINRHSQCPSACLKRANKKLVQYLDVAARRRRKIRNQAGPAIGKDRGD
jgi:hypothetical protein